MRIAILGAGGWGKNLVRVFCELLGEDAVTVVDPDAACRDAMKSNHPGIAVTESPPWSELDAAVIAAPAPLHYQLASDALNAGLHVLAEKPMTLSTGEATTLIEMAKMQDCTLMVDHLLEYHPAVVELRRLVHEGVLGRIYHMTSQRLNLGVIRQEENALWSLAPHDISVMLDLLQEEPVEVIARGEVYLQEDVEDVTHVTLTFPSGVLGHIHTSWLDPVKVRRLTVVGSRCMTVFDDMAEDKLVLYRHEIAMGDGVSPIRASRGTAEIVDLPRVEPLHAMAQEFLRSVETGNTPRSDGYDGLRVVRVLEQAQRSIEGRRRNESARERA